MGGEQHSALWRVEKEAHRRLDDLVLTVERLLENARDERVLEIRADLDRIQNARASLGETFE